MAKLTIVSKITAKADTIDLVKAELEKPIDIICAEEGCLQIQSVSNPVKYSFQD